MKVNINTDDAHALVDMLNNRHFELTEDIDSPFGYWSNGFAEAITYYEYTIWSSEADGYPSEDQSLTGMVFVLLTNHMKKINVIEPESFFYGPQWD